MGDNEKPLPQKKTHPILDMVLIVELEDAGKLLKIILLFHKKLSYKIFFSKQTKGNNKKEPFISYRYPKLIEATDPFSKSVTQFCFPDVSALPTENLET